MNKPAKVEAAESLTLLGALALALPSLEAAKKTANNPHFKSRYADLGSVIDAIRPVAEYGVWFVQHPHENEHGAMVETFYIGHGEQISAGTLFVPADKQNAHGFGSALTYARRYGLLTAFGLPTDDDDGNAASAAPPRGAVRDKAGESTVSPDGPKPRENWGGRYPTKTKLREARVIHHAELERLGLEGTFDDLEHYLTSPEYQDYIKQAGEHFPSWLEGERPPDAPPEYIQTFSLEQRSRDLIALRGNQPVEKEPA